MEDNENKENIDESDEANERNHNIWMIMKKKILTNLMKITINIFWGRCMQMKKQSTLTEIFPCQDLTGGDDWLL